MAILKLPGADSTSFLALIIDSQVVNNYTILDAWFLVLFSLNLQISQLNLWCIIARYVLSGWGILKEWNNWAKTLSSFTDPSVLLLNWFVVKFHLMQLDSIGKPLLTFGKTDSVAWVFFKDCRAIVKRNSSNTNRSTSADFCYNNLFSVIYNLVPKRDHYKFILASLNIWSFFIFLKINIFSLSLFFSQRDNFLQSSSF